MWGREADSPRGRIYLMKASLEGRQAIDAAFTRHIDACLGCMACVPACPSGVKYDRLVEGIRPCVEQATRRSLADRIVREAIFSVFPHPKRLRALRAALSLAQRAGLQRAFRASGLPSLLPPRLAALERLTPVLSRPEPPLPAVIPAAGSPRRRVVMLLGCVQRVFFPAVNAATARVLAAEGCEVHVPRDQGCCGALMLHAGRAGEAAASARRTIDALGAADFDHVVINAAGCGSAMKTYGTLLADDPRYAARARAFSAKCVDVSELLAALEPKAPRHPIAVRAAYHDACHLQHAQGVKTAPRRVLGTIPGLELREIAEPDMCCGSAGVYNLLEPSTAATLRDRKTTQVLRTAADIVVSSNPGCLLQIASGLEAAGAALPTMHLVELLDASIHNRRAPHAANRPPATPIDDRARVG